MKTPVERKDDTVSEIIGTLLIFSILVSVFTTFIIWYIPFSGGQYETQYEVATQHALSGISNQLLSASIKNNSVYSENMPLGIQGSFFNDPTSTQLSFSKNFNISMHYNVSIQVTYSGNTPPGVLANKTYGKPVPVGLNPDGVAVDTYNNLIFVLNSNYSKDVSLQSSRSPPVGGSLTVISGATDYYNKPVGNISLLGYPTGITFDPNNKFIFVTEGNLNGSDFSASPPTFKSGFIQVINGSSTNMTPFKTIYFSSVPYDVTYIPYLNHVMLTIQYSDYNSSTKLGYGGAVLSLNAQNFAETSYLQVAPLYSNIIPSSIAYDPANGYVYVALGSTIGIAIVNPITNQEIGNIPSSTPWSTVYDTSNGYVFATESNIGGSNEPATSSGRHLLVVSGANNEVVKSYSQFLTPVSLVYDPYNHLVYVADFQNSSVYIFNGVNGTYRGYVANYTPNAGPGNGPNAMAWDSTNGQIYVPNWNTGTLSIISGSTSVNNQFSQTDKNFKPSNTIRGYGQIQAFGSTPFTPQTYYDLQDGFVVQQGSGSSFGESIGGLPLEITGSTGIVGISSTFVNMSGQDSSISQTGNYLLTGKINSLDQQVWNTGRNLEFLYGGQQFSANVTSIILNNLSLTINSSAYAAWNYSFYTRYNSTAVPYNPDPNGSMWLFDSLPLMVHVQTGSITITVTKPIILQSFQYNYLSSMMNI
ncbi:MAG: YncE family protein [Thermoplasmataceae archaeon]